IQLLQRRRAEFVARAGRECVLTAYSVRRKRDAATGLGQVQFFENAAAMAAHGLRLANLSESHNAPLYYEAAVGGGIPVVKTLRESLAGNTIQRVAGILNGTCNYILSRMEAENLP